MKTIQFEYVKSTKNTHKYEEVPAPGSPAIVGSLYVQKWAFPVAPPTLTIQVTSEVKSNIMPAPAA